MIQRVTSVTGRELAARSESGAAAVTFVPLGRRSEIIRHPHPLSLTRKRTRRRPRVDMRVVCQYMHSTMEKLSGRRTYP
jgi:hypothetical protein